MTIEQLYAAEVIDRLAQRGDELAPAYRTADPFPHTVIDNFLPSDVLVETLPAFPQPRQLPHTEFNNQREVKLQYHHVELLPQPFRDLLFFLNSPPVLQFLERMTGISGLIPDPYLTGGGLHQIEPGGKLDVHADFNLLERLKLDRRLNLLLYLNQDWREDYGGHLELWDRSMTRCVRKILPVLNRCVIFSTTDFAYHGHPTPLSCPAGMSRKSLALYYYTNGRPEAERTNAHSTLFRDRPGEKSDRTPVLTGVRTVLRAVTPPIVASGYRFVRSLAQS